MTARDVRRTLVAYDVSDDRRRTRIAKALTRYGDRVQYSVFIVDVGPVRRRRLVERLEDLLDPLADSLLLCDLGPLDGHLQHRFVCLGLQRPITEPDSFLL